MIRNIGNSFIGGFFRRLGSIFALFFILAFIGFLLKDLDTDSLVNKLLGLQKINASSTDFTPFNRNIGIYDCTSSNSCTSKPVTRSTFTYNNSTYNTYTTDSTLTIATNGIAFSFNPQTILKGGYLYSATLYYCNWEDLSGVTSSTISAGLPGSEIENYYRTSTTSRLNNFSASGLPGYCYFTTSVFSPKSNSGTLSLRLKKDNGSIRDFTPYVYGYNLKELGVYTSEIDSIVKSAINSSGLATSNSINEVNTNITNMENNIVENNNNLLGSKCSNEYNGIITGSNQNLGTFKPNTNYYFSFKGTITGYNIRAGSGGILLAYCTTNKCQFTTDSTGNVFFNGWGLSGSLTDVMLSQTSYTYCEYGSISSKLDDTNKSINNINDTLSSSNTTEAETEASDLFTNYNMNTHGITGIITSPLNLIQSLLSKTCSPLELPLPFVNDNLSLPCMTSIYQENFPTFLTLYQLIISALIGYRICVSVFFMVKDFKNPDSDKIEVLDL